MLLVVVSIIGGSGSGSTPPMMPPPSTPCPNVPVITNTIASNNLKNCLQQVLNNILKPGNTSNQQNTIDGGGIVVGIIKDFSGNIPGFNWTLQNGNISGNAETTPTYNKTNNTVTTTFSNTAFSNASDISIARTMLHKSVHAFLVMYFTNNPITGTNPVTTAFPTLINDWSTTNDYNAAQHNTMVTDFMNDITVALEQYGNSRGYNVPDANYYSDLAWGGLATDTNGNPTSLFLSLVPNQSDSDRILNRISIEQTGYDLQGNPQPQVGKPGGC